MKTQESACPSTFSKCRHWTTTARRKRKKKKNACNNWIKCSVMRYHVVLQVLRQSCLLHCAYHWVSQHFVRPVGLFRVDVMRERSWIQFCIFRGEEFLCKVFFPISIILRRTRFYLVMWHWFVAFFKSRLIILLDPTCYFFQFSMSFNNRGAKRKKISDTLISHMKQLFWHSEMSAPCSKNFIYFCIKLVELPLAPPGKGVLIWDLLLNSY